MSQILVHFIFFISGNFISSFLFRIITTTITYFVTSYFSTFLFPYYYICLLFYFSFFSLGGIETAWVVMFKPEMRNVKNGPSSRALMAVKYPTRDTLRSTDTGGESYNIGFNSGLYLRTLVPILFS